MAPAARSLMLAGTLGLVPGAAQCAEWAATPVIFLDADYQSNRVLHEGAPESQALSASFDLELARRTEEGLFSITPHYYARRISPKVEADLNDLRVPAQWQLNFERATLEFSALYADESTLTTELAETGEVRADSSRLMRATGAAWSLNHSDTRQLNVTANFEDVNYTGDNDTRLNDYRYGAASVGERFLVSARATWTVSGFGSRLRSPDLGNDNAEAGVAVGLDYHWGENTRISGELGFSRRDFDGDQSSGRTGNFTLEHFGERRQWKFTLDQSLVPYGTGVLTERDMMQLSLNQDFSARLSVNGRLNFVRNDEAKTGYFVDVHTYRYADLEMRWVLAEHWSASIIGGYSDAQDPGVADRVGGWTLALRTAWTPNRRVFAH